MESGHTGLKTLGRNSITISLKIWTFTEPNFQSAPTFLTWKPQTSPDLPHHSGWINGDWNLFSQPLASLIKKKKNQTFGAHKPFKLLIGINHAAGFNLIVRVTHLAVEHNSCGPSFAKKQMKKQIGEDRSESLAADGGHLLNTLLLQWNVIKGAVAAWLELICAHK